MLFDSGTSSAARSWHTVCFGLASSSFRLAFAFHLRNWMLEYRSDRVDLFGVPWIIITFLKC